MNTIDRQAITGVILAGGRGMRMGGVDKGLQDFRGVPLALHTLQRLAPQVGRVMISANRNLATYRSFGQAIGGIGAIGAMGAPVWPDETARGEYAGPLAGFVTALAHCETPFLLTVPCDTPLFPADLAERMAAALGQEDADVAIACAPDEQGELRAQAVFCLMRASLLSSLQRYVAAGGRKIQGWTAQHKTARVPFDQAGDSAQAFFNANTLAELQHLQHLQHLQQLQLQRQSPTSITDETRHA